MSAKPEVTNRETGDLRLDSFFAKVKVVVAEAQIDEVRKDDLDLVWEHIATSGDAKMLAQEALEKEFSKAGERGEKEIDVLDRKRRPSKLRRVEGEDGKFAYEVLGENGSSWYGVDQNWALAMAKLGHDLNGAENFVRGSF